MIALLSDLTWHNCVHNFNIIILFFLFTVCTVHMQGYSISCDKCYKTFLHDPQYAKGDPRNLVLIGHWDGFQPFRSTGKHGCGKTRRIHTQFTGRL